MFYCRTFELQLLLSYSNKSMATKNLARSKEIISHVVFTFCEQLKCCDIISFSLLIRANENLQWRIDCSVISQPYKRDWTFVHDETQIHRKICWIFHWQTCRHCETDEFSFSLYSVCLGYWMQKLQYGLLRWSKKKKSFLLHLSLNYFMQLCFSSSYTAF